MDYFQYFEATRKAGTENFHACFFDAAFKGSVDQISID